MSSSLGKLDLGWLFAPALSAELPPDIFARRATRQMPGMTVVPGPKSGAPASESITEPPPIATPAAPIAPVVPLAAMPALPPVAPPAAKPASPAAPLAAKLAPPRLAPKPPVLTMPPLPVPLLPASPAAVPAPRVTVPPPPAPLPLVPAPELPPPDEARPLKSLPTPPTPIPTPLPTRAGGRPVTPPPIASSVSASELALEPELPQPGHVLGKYRLERAVGIGGFGAVYRARHLVLDTIVAIKLMRPSLIHARPALVRLLTEEARFAAQIDHPNVVRVYDVETTDEHTYIVMEHIDGPDLSVMMRRRGALPYKMVIRILLHIAAALSAGLAKKLIHRDVKPSNILLTRAGVTKLADFGLARSSHADGVGIRGTVGTAAYMAPEQTSDPARVDFRSDIYSLGVTAFHALTGELPFPDHDAHKIAEAHRTRAVVLPSRVASTIPSPLAALVVAMMAKNPNHRPPSYASLEAELGSIR